MADVNRDRFNQRVGVLKKKADPNVRVVRRVQEDGLVVDVAQTKSAARSLLPIKGLIATGIIFLAFKSFLLAELGETEYLERIDGMKTGSAMEVAAAFLLDMDPATQAIANTLKTFLN
ncbi:MAG: hypothetical protein OXC60_17890 [Litoreibacter sp.]|nr:hypothetical protein [Litoreibacter sp.]